MSSIVTVEWFNKFMHVFFFSPIQLDLLFSSMCLFPSSQPSSISVDSTAKVFATLSAFKTLSDKKVKPLIQNLALKSCLLDPMPSRLVSKCDALILVITTIINKSLEAGLFPESWKEALVCPSSTSNN